MTGDRISCQIEPLVKAGMKLLALLHKWPNVKVGHVANLGFVGASRPEGKRRDRQRSVP
jgi:hypothetical protein